jgi:hypothetical protein
MSNVGKEEIAEREGAIEGRLEITAGTEREQEKEEVRTWQTTRKREQRKTHDQSQHH